jgi:hypothetical protein
VAANPRLGNAEHGGRLTHVQEVLDCEMFETLLSPTKMDIDSRNIHGSLRWWENIRRKPLFGRRPQADRSVHVGHCIARISSIALLFGVLFVPSLSVPL